MPPDLKYSNRFARNELETTTRRSIFDELDNKPLTDREKLNRTKEKLKRFEKQAKDDAYLLDGMNNIDRKSVRFDTNRKAKERKLKKTSNEEFVDVISERPYTPEYTKTFTIGRGYRPDIETKVKKTKIKQGYPSDNQYRAVSRSSIRSSIEEARKPRSATFIRTSDGGRIQTYPRVAYTPPKRGINIHHGYRKVYTYPDRDPPPLDGYKPKGKPPTTPIGFKLNRTVEIPDYMHHPNHDYYYDRYYEDNEWYPRSQSRKPSADSTRSYGVRLPYIEPPPNVRLSRSRKGYRHQPKLRTRSRSGSLNRPLSSISRASTNRFHHIKEYHWSDRINELAQPRKYRKYRNYYYDNDYDFNHHPQINHEMVYDIKLKRWLSANKKRMAEIDRKEKERLRRIREKELLEPRRGDMRIIREHVQYIPKKVDKIPVSIIKNSTRQQQIEQEEILNRRRQYDELIRRHHSQNHKVYTTIKPQSILKVVKSQPTIIRQQVETIQEPQPPKISKTGKVKYTRRVAARKKDDACPYQDGGDTSIPVKSDNKNYGRFDIDFRNDHTISNKPNTTLDEIDRQLEEVNIRQNRLEQETMSENEDRGSLTGRNYLEESAEPGEKTVTDIESEASGVRNPKSERESVVIQRYETNSEIERRERRNHSTWPTHKIDYSGKSQVQCIVRAMTHKMPEIKRGIKTDNGNESEVINFGSNFNLEQIEDMDMKLKPYYLKWDHPFIKKADFTDPIYLSIPVQTPNFNDVLQQIIFIYRIDNNKWDYKQCEIKNIKTNDGIEYNVAEVPFNEPFEKLSYGLKVRYKEDTREFLPLMESTLQSSMDSRVRATVLENCYEAKSKLSIRLEPLDMNETDLSEMMASTISLHAVAVSPVIKITSSEPMYVPIKLEIPSPGHSVYGSKKLGMKCSLNQVKNIRVHLLTKTNSFTRYQIQDTLHNELAKQYNFPIQIPQKNGVCYCVLIMDGVEPISPLYESKKSRNFINGNFLKNLSLKIAVDESKVKTIGRQLVNITSTESKTKQHDPSVACYKLLRMWRNQNANKSDSILIDQLCKALSLCNMSSEVEEIRADFKRFLSETEQEKILDIFKQVSDCPAVTINWKYIARVLALDEIEITQIDKTCSNIREKSLKMFQRSLNLMKSTYKDMRTVLQAYISVLKESGCPKIAEHIEKRHMGQFDVNIN